MLYKKDYKIDGSFLRQLRIDKKLTQEQVAEFLNCKVAYVSALELGRTKNPSVDRLAKLAQLYGFERIEDLITGEQRSEKVAIDLIKILSKADSVMYGDQEIPLNYAMKKKIEMGIRMGICWSLEERND